MLLLGVGRMDPATPCGFINLRTAIFKGLKDALSLETPALHNGVLFPCWGCDFIWRKCLRMGEGRGYFLVWGGHKASPLALLPQGTGALMGRRASRPGGTSRGGAVPPSGGAEQKHCWEPPMLLTGHPPHRPGRCERPGSSPHMGGMTRGTLRPFLPPLTKPSFLDGDSGL